MEPCPQIGAGISELIAVGLFAEFTRRVDTVWNQAWVRCLTGVVQITAPSHIRLCFMDASAVHTGIRGAAIAVIAIRITVTAGIINLNILANPVDAFCLLTGKSLVTHPTDIVVILIGRAATW